MGSICIFGVDDNPVLKDFVRAHVEYLSGTKVCVSGSNLQYAHDSKTIRTFYSSAPARRRAKRLLPHAVYQRITQGDRHADSELRDSLGAFFRQHDVDVILAEFGTVGADIAPYAREHGIPLVVHFHGHDAHRLSVVNPYRERYKEMFAYASSILSVSRYMTDALIELGADPDKIVYNPYGPRDEFFEIAPDYRPTALSLGRFTDIKANHLTLMAFRKALESVPDARLVMAGDGELLETCRTLARVWGIDSRVSFPGAVRHAEVLDLFHEACCFAQHSVSPSYGDAEGTPVVILEAMAAGLPVVATRHAGITDAVVDGSTGFLVDELDVNGMAANLARLLSDPALAQEMGVNARDHIRKSYSMSRHIERLQAAIDTARVQ